MTAARLEFRTFSLLRSARLAVVEGHRVAIVCADEHRRQALAQEYYQLYPHGPAPDFVVPMVPPPVTP
jgi:DNA polymerase IIIc chi subunit